MDLDTSATNLKVVIVEDDRALREILGIVLEEYPHQIAFAENGQRALELAAQLAPELILIDLGLPDMHGFDLARALRARNLAPRPRLVAFTGFDGEDFRREAREAGFDDFYLKPMDLTAMERTFERIFALARD